MKIYRNTDAWQRFAAAALTVMMERADYSPRVAGLTIQEAQRAVAIAAADYADALWLEMHSREAQDAQETTTP